MGIFGRPRRASEASSAETAIDQPDSSNDYGKGKSGENGGPVQRGWKGRQDPFADGGVGDGKTKYQTMEWWQAGMVMIAGTISIGILSLPSVLAAIGLVP